MNDVLAVIDMQNDFVSGSLGTKEAQAIVQNVVKKIETFSGNIVFTQVFTCSALHKKYGGMGNCCSD